MKNKNLIATLLLGVLASHAVQAAPFGQKGNNTTCRETTEINIVGYSNYAPFGWKIPSGVDFSLNSNVKPFLDRFIDTYKMKDVNFIPYDDMSVAENEIRSGKADVIIGLYYNPSPYSGIEYIYPAFINNPISVAMMPARISEVKNVADLKNLKGVYRKDEPLGDFVLQKAKEGFTLTEVDNSYKAFDAIISGKADYFLTSKYSGVAEAMKYGIYDRVSFSKQGLWNVQMFLGLSKLSVCRSFLSKKLTKAVEEYKKSGEYETDLQDTMNQIQQENYGKVPVLFSDVKQ